MRGGALEGSITTWIGVGVAEGMATATPGASVAPGATLGGGGDAAGSDPAGVPTGMGDADGAC